MANVIGWLVWYDDGTVYDSRRHLWEDLPEDGMQIRMLYYDDGRRQIQQGADYFYEAPHPEGTIYGSGTERDEIERRYPGAVIKRGKWLPDDYYQRLVTEAMAIEWDG